MNDKVNENLSALMDSEWGSTTELNDLLAKLDSDPSVREKFERYHLVRDAMHKEHSSILDSDFSSRVSAAIAEEPSIVAFAKEDKATTNKVTNIHSRQQDRQIVNPRAEGSLPQSDSKGRTEVAATESAAESAADTGVAEFGARKSSAGAAKGSAKSNWSSNWSSNWTRGLGGFAIAASVALVSLLGLKTLQQPSAGPAGQSVVAGNSATDAAPVVAGQNGIQGVLPVGGTTIAQTQPVQGQQAGAQQPVGEQPVIKIAGPTPGYEAPLEYVANTSTYWVIPNQKRSHVTETRLNMFLSQHIEHSPTADMGGMLPYSRLAGYDAVPAQTEPSEKE